MTLNPIHVVVGVVLDDQQRVLIALRPATKHQGGLWEFPGGKVEPGESAQQALARELLEELGIDVTDSRALLECSYDYGDKSVLLDVWWVDAFKQEAIGREGQPIRWVLASELSDYAFPAANTVIVEAIQAQLLVS